MKTSKINLKSDEIIKCIVCPGECKSFAFYPTCDPFNPEIPFKPLPAVVNLVTEDFFGQFIKKEFRPLTRADVARFLDRMFILCPDCHRSLPLNPTSDDYLICSFCKIHWDLRNDRNISKNVHIVDARLLPDGSLYRHKVVQTDQLNLLDVPF